MKKTKNIQQQCDCGAENNFGHLNSCAILEKEKEDTWSVNRVNLKNQDTKGKFRLKPKEDFYGDIARHAQTPPINNRQEDWEENLIGLSKNYISNRTQYKTFDILKLIQFIKDLLKAQRAKDRQELIKGLKEEYIDSIDKFYGKGEIEHGFETAFNKGITKAIELLSERGEEK